VEQQEQNINEQENFENQNTSEIRTVLPKPILEQDKQNWIRKSLISLAIYVVLFYVIFNQDLINIAAVIVVLMIHEMGHFFAMKLFNYNNVKLFFVPLLGAFVTGKKSTISQRQMSVVILAGPLPGILIGLGLLYFDYISPNERVHMLGNIFFVINIFNLLPFMPLDGGRLLETLFMKQNHIIRVVFTIISIVALIILAISMQSIIFLIIPVSMIFELINEIKNQKIRDFLNQEKINYVCNYNELPDKDYWTIRDGIVLSFNKRYAPVQAGVMQYSILEGSLVQHVISVLKTPTINDLKIFGKIAVSIIYVTFLVIIPLIILFIFL
jgi:stage IV sporulation protein FB